MAISPVDPPGAALVRWRRLFVHLRPHRFAVTVILLTTLCVAGLNALEPLVLKHLFDGLGAGAGRERIALTLALLVALGVAKELGSAAANWLTWRTRLKVHFALTSATVDRLHSLPVSFHREERVGATMMRLDRGIQGIVGALSEVVFNLVPAVAYLAVAATVMARLDWRLAVLVLAFAPLPALVAHRAAPEQTQRERSLLERWSRIYARFNEVLSGIVTVKSFAMEEVEKRRFLTDVNEANGLVTRGVGRDARSGALQNLAVTAARVAALAFGGLLVLRGQLTLGSLVAFLGYVGGIFAPVQAMTGIYKTTQVARVSMDQVFGVLDAQSTLDDRPGALELAPVRGDVEFRDVRFAYQPGREPLIDGVNLQVHAGETVALVGPSGAGKTTLMALLQRLYDPHTGQVLVDGHDVREVQQLSLRRNIGVVLQDALLFNESVGDNIAYGVPSATQAQIEAAARAAHAHEFIQRFPEGYDTLVGDRGSRLSAGERQRVAIARALLKDPRILILDEPTSALDAESEALVQEALAVLMRGRTTFIIAHRLSTVTQVDRILVLRQGRLVEQGTHAQLMAAGGYYAALVSRQTRGLLPERMGPPAEGSSAPTRAA